MTAEMIQSELTSHHEVLLKVISQLQQDIKKATILCVNTLKQGQKIMFFGNGGSAADAQHLAAELTGRYKKERKGLPGIALTSDISAVTAIGNDYDFEYIFQRQVEAIAKKDDLLVGLSSTGNSKNVIEALETGKKIGCKTLGLSGKGGGRMNNCCDINIVIPSDITARIQEMHIVVGHILCQAIDNEM